MKGPESFWVLLGIGSGPSIFDPGRCRLMRPLRRSETVDPGRKRGPGNGRIYLLVVLD